MSLFLCPILGSQRSGVAGAFAGAVSVLATMPQDTVKTRMQGCGGVTILFRNDTDGTSWSYNNYGTMTNLSH